MLYNAKTRNIQMSRVIKQLQIYLFLLKFSILQHFFLLLNRFTSDILQQKPVHRPWLMNGFSLYADYRKKTVSCTFDFTATQEAV